MESEEIEVFLAIVNNGSIARAADSLHIQQSAASTRLKNLENELGITLIQRQQGVRRVALTADGENFLTLARQWKTLQRQAYSLKSSKTYQQLRIACTDAINNAVFIDLYPWFISNHPDVELYLQTEHSTEIHQLIEAQKIDAGFAFNLHLFPNVLSLPIYEDKLVVICHKDNPYLETHIEKDLCPENEIYAVYSDAFESWHRSIFHDDRHRATIGTLSMLPHFLNYPGSWSIIPHVAADRLMLQHHDLVIAELSHQPSFRQTCYLLYNRNSGPWIKDLITLFLIDLCKVLQSMPVKLLINENNVNEFRSSD